MTVFIFGVSGCGKTTVARELAEQLTCSFLEADDFHPQANIEKMMSGSPLSDDDREPWLHSINHALLQLQHSGRHAVAACSALKRSYRSILQQNLNNPLWVLIDGSESELLERLHKRTSHFMPPNLLRSQLDTLEPPHPGEALTLSAGTPLSQQIHIILQHLEKTG